MLLIKSYLFIYYLLLSLIELSFTLTFMNQICRPLETGDKFHFTLLINK